jgi:hypothetical protein
MTNAPLIREWSQMSLRDIALVTGTDKLKHKFEDKYEFHLGPQRLTPITLLEIGVKKGASLTMWERFFPNATIFGIDITPQCAAMATDRSTVFIGDQADRQFLHDVARKIGRPLDVVIDDGGHTMEQQRTSFDVLFEYVRPGGFYIIEDIHTSYRADRGGGPAGKPGTFVAMLKDMIDDLHFKFVRLQGGQDKYPIAELHIYPKLCFVKKADPASRISK